MKKFIYIMRYVRNLNYILWYDKQHNRYLAFNHNANKAACGWEKISPVNKLLSLSVKQLEKQETCTHLLAADYYGNKKPSRRCVVCAKDLFNL